MKLSLRYLHWSLSDPQWTTLVCTDQWSAFYYSTCRQFNSLSIYMFKKVFFQQQKHKYSFPAINEELYMWKKVYMYYSFRMANITCTVLEHEMLMCNGTKFEKHEHAFVAGSPQFWIYLSVYIFLMLFAGKLKILCRPIIVNLRSTTL